MLSITISLHHYYLKIVILLTLRFNQNLTLYLRGAGAANQVDDNGHVRGLRVLHLPVHQLPVLGQEEGSRHLPHPVCPRRLSRLQLPILRPPLQNPQRFSAAQTQMPQKVLTGPLDL